MVSYLLLVTSIVYTAGVTALVGGLFSTTAPSHLTVKDVSGVWIMLGSLIIIVFSIFLIGVSYARW